MGVLASIINRSISGSFSSDACRVVGERAFARCTNLSSVSFPNAMVVDYYSFSNCTNLSSASFPKALCLQNDAFYGCSNLTTLYIGTGTTTVCTLGANVFQDCPNLANIYVPSSLVDKYKSATNWSEYADKIKAAS